MALKYIYKPKLITRICFVFILIASLCLYLYRDSAIFSSSTISSILPDFKYHISNFSISFGLVIGVGLIMLLIGESLKHVLIFVLLVIVTNFIYELFLTIINTKDIIDAYYGLVGCLLAFPILIIVKNKGLLPI